MAQGDILDLHDRIEANLESLRKQKPECYRNVQAHLKGWDVDLPADDYWIEVTRSDHLANVTTEDGWQRVKLLLAGKPEPVRLPEPQMIQATAPLVLKASAAPSQSAATGTNRRSSTKQRVEEESPWFWPRPGKIHAASVGRQALRPAQRTGGGPLAAHPRMPDDLLRARCAEMVVKRSRKWDASSAAERSRLLQEENAQWRRMNRSYSLRRLWLAISTWVNRQRGGWEAWRLTHITAPRPPQRRPEWAGERDNYLRFTHVATSKRWELDLMEDWRRIQPEANALADQSMTDQSAGRRDSDRAQSEIVVSLRASGKVSIKTSDPIESRPMPRPVVTVVPSRSRAAVPLAA